MIGQENLKAKLLSNLKNIKNLLLVGNRLSGRKTLIYEVSKELEIPVIEVSSNVSSINQIKENEFSIVIYLFPDIDDWSKSSLSAVLKQLEENEHNIYILTCKNVQFVNTTISSRCLVEYMEIYTEEQIGNRYCSNIGQLELFNNKDYLSFIDRFIIAANKNVFHLTSSLENEFAFKKEDEGYDLDLFFTVFENVLIERILDNNMNNTLLKLLDHIVKYHLEINIKYINKKLLFNAFVTSF